MTGLTGTGALLRLAMRRDRVSLSAWVLGLAALTAAFTAMSVGALPMQQDVISETQLVAENPALRMLGLPSGASVGGYAMIRGYLTLAILAALMSTLAVVRHTRQNEETGRAELLGATVLGRQAGLAAAVIEAVAANVVLAPLLGLAMIVNGQPAVSSLAAGCAVSGVGIVFTGVAAVTTQLASTTRGANGLAGAVLGCAFVLSGAGNVLGTVDASGLRVVSAWPAWLSPIGWGQQMRPFGGDRWWPLILFAVSFAVLLGVAGVLVRRRDTGRGIFPERRGRATASPGLRGPFGLVWRLQRGALLGWAAGMLAFGLIFGTLSDQITDLQGSARDWYVQMGGTDQIVDAYRASVIELAGMTVAIYVVQMLLRMRADEAGGSLEPVLAGAVSRPRWAMGHILNAGLGATGLLLLFATSMGLTVGRVLGDTPAQLGDLAAAALAQLPAILVLGGVVIAAVGLLPRWAVPVAWGALAASILLGPLFGPDLGGPQWAQDVSPFTHTPDAPAAAITATPVAGLLTAFAALGLAGLASVRRRDLFLPA